MLVDKSTPTSQVDFFPSLHGQERRQQRNISKKDLQTVIKYGTRKRTHPCPRTGAFRWKYTHGDLVYITDEAGAQEVTSWATELPLNKKMTMQPEYFNAYYEAKRRITEDPSIITSHSVVIVDMSGSMRKSDMHGHRSRAKGVYHNIAEELIASQLPPVESGIFSTGITTFTDVVTVIEMRDSANKVISCEPISWVLYNQIVDLYLSSQPSYHGYYYHSFQLAFEALNNQPNDHCSLSLFVFSDGVPSDGRSYGKLFPNILHNLLKLNCTKYGQRLTFSAVGFGRNDHSFSILRELVNVASAANCKSFFAIDSFDDSGLTSILQSTLLNMSSTKMMLTGLHHRVSSQCARDIKENAASIDDRMKFCFNSVANYQKFSPHLIPGIEIKRTVMAWVRDERIGIYRSSYQIAPFLNENAVGFAVSSHYFSSGAERKAYVMTEINEDGQPVGDHLVAKESIYSTLQKMQTFHRIFVTTQNKADKWATKFNEMLDRMDIPQTTPRIKFLPCSIYSCNYHDLNTNKKTEFAYLVEAYLNPKNYCK